MTTDVRSGTMPVLARFVRTMSLDDEIRAQPERGRDRQTKGLRGFQVDRKLELRGLLHRKIAGPGPLENLVDVHGAAPELVLELDP